MKTKAISILILLITVTLATLQAQKVRPDQRLQLLKEDSQNSYQSNSITNLDLLQALDFAGIQIKKFNLGEFQERYQLHLITETYKDSCGLPLL